MPLPLPEGVDQSEVVAVLFRKGVLRKKDVDALLAQWGLDPTKLQDTPLSWRWEFAPLPKGADFIVREIMKGVYVVQLQGGRALNLQAG